MAEIERRERFNDVFQMVLIIETLLIEYAWTIQVKNIEVILCFYIATLIFWIFSHLKGGNWEYGLKLLDFQMVIFTIGMLLSVFIFSAVPPHVILVIDLFVVPISSFLVTLPIINYLTNYIKRESIFFFSICILIGMLIAGVLLSLTWAMIF